MYNLTKGIANTLLFVMVDTDGAVVTGLGSGFTLTLSKNGAAFGASTGAKAELGNGWYSYVASADECDTVGPLGVLVTGAGAVQQNLVFEVTTNIWELPHRTLNMTTDQILALARGGHLILYQGATWEQPLTVRAFTDTSELYFTVKDDSNRPDAQAIIQIHTDTDLLYVNGSSPGDSGDGSITVDDAAAGAITVMLEPNITLELAKVEKLYYDVCEITTGGAVNQLAEGHLTVRARTTKAIT